MQTDYHSTIQASLQPTAVTSTSPENSSLLGEAIRVPKQEEDDHCIEGPAGSQANLEHDVVSSLMFDVQDFS